MDIEDEIDRLLRGDNDDQEDDMSNSKQGSWAVALLAGACASILGPIVTEMASRWFGGIDETADSVIELSTEVRGLKDQVGRLLAEPYATRDELREMRTEFAGFDERLDKLERSEFSKPASYVPGRK